ncbi:hypothetical protein J6Q66_06820 [bacterium]|nr:hypothetical protein [bacterium]
MTYVKKVVRAADGQKIREVYTVAAKNNPKNHFSFIVDSTKGLKEIISSQNGVSITKQGDVIEHCTNGAKQIYTSVAGVNSSLKNSFDALKSQGWVKFLENSIRSCCK